MVWPLGTAILVKPSLGPTVSAIPSVSANPPLAALKDTTEPTWFVVLVSAADAALPDSAGAMMLLPCVWVIAPPAASAT